MQRITLSGLLVRQIVSSEGVEVGRHEGYERNKKKHTESWRIVQINNRQGWGRVLILNSRYSRPVAKTVKTYRPRFLLRTLVVISNLFVISGRYLPPLLQILPSTLLSLLVEGQTRPRIKSNIGYSGRKLTGKIGMFYEHTLIDKGRGVFNILGR